MRMTSFRNVIYLFLSLLICFLSGCVLEDPVERGEVCPPGDMRNVNDEPFVSFNTMDCYKDYEILVDVAPNVPEQCTSCTASETMLGTIWNCKKMTESCLNKLSEKHRTDYIDCTHYRDNLVFDNSSDENGESKNRIRFVHDYKGDNVQFETVGVDNTTRYCPVDFRDCQYKAFKNNESENALTWYGCVQPCELPYLYCNEKDGSQVCVNPSDNPKHCGAKGSCSNDDPNSLNWVGEDCDGGDCRDGKCICYHDYSLCESLDDGICYDILHDSAHCGVNCEPCADGYYCRNGICETNKCGEQKLCMQFGTEECNNLDSACGPSCRDCTDIMNSTNASCDKMSGECIIVSCAKGYHVEYDESNGFQVCIKNTKTACAHSELRVGETINDEGRIVDCTQRPNQTDVFCNDEGECEDLSCIKSFIVNEGTCMSDKCDNFCAANEQCVNGVCECKPGYTNCGKDVGCVNIVEDNKDFCGGCVKEEFKCYPELEPKTHVTASNCVHGRCTIQGCKTYEEEQPGYHLYLNEDDQYVCEENDVNHCGEHDKNCMKLNTHVDADTAKCVNAKCEFECKDDFHFYDENCEQDDIQNCGGHDNPCLIDNADKVVCENHTCLVSKCNINYHIYNNKCVLDDDDNCGKVDHKCDKSLHYSCQDGDCKCAINYTSCIGINGTEVCVDTTSDNNHCGTCGHVCPANAKCSGSTCKCNDSNQLFCDEHCVDYKSDKNNCGACGNVCSGGQECCNGHCVDYKTDIANCGSCNNSCGSGQYCNGGTCQCHSDTTCGKSCVNTNTDNNNCGGCGNKCESGKHCSGGGCVCDTGTTPCGSSCVNTNSDNNNCGGCGNKCELGKHCSGGGCVCDTGTTPCGSNCVNTNSDNNNCGGCGNRCGSGKYCSGGSCRCSWGTDCGSCVDVSSDNNNCGWCGNRCTGNYYCSGGSCVTDSCTGGTIKCGGSCVGAWISGTVTASSLRVRAEPNTSSSQIGSLYNGNSVNFYGYVYGESINGNSKWYILSGGGYVSAYYISVTSGSPQYCEY